ADEVLRSNGWFSQDDAERQEVTRQSHHHLPRLTSPDGFVSLELHRFLHELDGAERAEGYLARSLRLSLTAPTEEAETTFQASTLGTEDHLISLATHFGLDRTVYYQSYAALRQLTDLHLVITRSKVDWPLLRRLAEDASLLGFAWLGIESAVRLFASPVPDPIRAELRGSVPRAEQIERFIDCKVLEPSPWVLHQLVDPEERSTWSLSKALVRRFFWDPRYLREKFGAGSRKRYRRHASDILATVRHIPKTLDQLRVDGWMAELHQRASTT
ncbi:MAG: nucleotidyltransferase family protein, partial [Acidobacteriota bacterium]